MARDPLNELRADLERLRVEFERYFMGLERRMPSVQREKLAKQIRRFDAGQDSVLRFRHRNLVQRLIVLEQYWGRIIRAMEAGTYSRDVARANFREQRREEGTHARQKTTPARNREAEKKAAAVGAEAEAFLAQMGQSLAASPIISQTENESATKKATPRFQMRGRSKRSEKDELA